MKMIMMKFGGTSVGDGKRIANVAKLVQSEKRPKVVVVSAMSGVTDSLIGIADKVVTLPASVVEGEVDRFHREISTKHEQAALDAISDEDVRNEISENLSMLLNKLRVALLGIGYLGDLSPKSMDYILSFGERLSIEIMAGALESIGVPAKPLTGYEAGIVTDSHFGRARPISAKMVKLIKPRMESLAKKGITPVVAGFIAANEEGIMTTLGRGGSDYTASLIGRHVRAAEVQIWTDVDGILTTDPKFVPTAKLIHELSYVEAMDLAYFGAKVIHSKMIEPAMLVNIPVRVLNTFNPKCKGTLIVRKQKKVEGVVKAVAVAKNVVIVNFQGIGMAETPNIAGRIFSTLGENNINVMMISGSSESSISFVIAKSDIDKTIELLESEFEDEKVIVKNLELIENACIVTIVGAGMQGAKGIAAKIFQTVANENVNIIMIAQGSSEVNVAFMINEKDVKKTLRALHKRLIEQNALRKISK